MNWCRSVFSLMLLCVGCSQSANDERALRGIFGASGQKLCVAPIRFPASLDPTAPQYWFESVMMRNGVLRITGDRNGKRFINLSPAFQKFALTTSYLPGYRRICFGTIRAVRMNSMNDSHGGVVTVNFHYRSAIEPWASELKRELHIADEGDSIATLTTYSNGTFGENWPPPTGIVNPHALYYPPNGKNWYPNGMPGAFMPKDLAV